MGGGGGGGILFLFCFLGVFYLCIFFKGFVFWVFFLFCFVFCFFFFLGGVFFVVVYLVTGVFVLKRGETTGCMGFFVGDIGSFFFFFEMDSTKTPKGMLFGWFYVTKKTPKNMAPLGVLVYSTLAMV